MSSILVECQGVSKVYRRLTRRGWQRTNALREASCAVERGQIVALVGPNGAGKTTLLSLIAGLIYPTQGRVAVCGFFPRSQSAHRGLSYVPEHPAFLLRYTGRAVLRYHGALLGLPQQQIKRKTDTLINLHGMRDYIDRRCGQYSQGMKQRLALAVALINDPQVLLLDEPSNGLDPVGIIHLRRQLQQLSHQGTAIVVSSHRLDELSKLTSHFLFINQGRLTSVRNPEEQSLEETFLRLCQDKDVLCEPMS